MLSITAAMALIQQHLGDTPRAAHSRVVATLMHHLAGVFEADAQLWEVVGLCHDLDFFTIADDWSQHGLLTVDWLAGQLPDDALRAIAAHDHRTGVQADTLLADMLKVADVVAVIDQRLGRDLFHEVAADESYTTLRRQLEDHPYLSNILEQYAGKHGLSLAQIRAMVTVVPVQPSLY
jgi:hypothetical protein